MFDSELVGYFRQSKLNDAVAVLEGISRPKPKIVCTGNGISMKRSILDVT